MYFEQNLWTNLYGSFKNSLLLTSLCWYIPKDKKQKKFIIVNNHKNGRISLAILIKVLTTLTDSVSAELSRHFFQHLQLGREKCKIRTITDVSSVMWWINWGQCLLQCWDNNTHTLTSENPSSSPCSINTIIISM